MLCITDNRWEIYEADTERVRSSRLYDSGLTGEAMLEHGLVHAIIRGGVYAHAAAL